MELRTQHISVLLLAAYVFLGGLAPASMCLDADGGSRVESLFDRCCTSSRHEHSDGSGRAGTHPSNGTVTQLAQASASCTDIPLLISNDRESTHRALQLSVLPIGYPLGTGEAGPLYRSLGNRGQGDPSNTELTARAYHCAILRC